MKDDVKTAIQSIHEMLVELSRVVFPEKGIIIHEDATKISYIPDKPALRPLLADAEVGWVCRRRDGKWVQLTKTDRDVIHDGESYPYEYVLHSAVWCVNVNGYWDISTGTHSTDIVSCEPLAPEGSAEWAWQMLKIGKPVTNKRVFIAGGYIKDTDSDKYHFVQMWGYSGWQLYEPKPEPAPFAVGDWVTDGVVTGKITSWGLGMAWVRPVDIHGEYHLYIANLRKLSPSEVRVKITLEGTVSKDYNETLDSFILNNADGHTRNRIKWSTIDPDTAKMVRELAGK
jgi:hypothetical protein